MKLVPVTVIFEAAEPAEKLAGASCVIDGTGLFTANDAATEVPPPGAGLTTVTARGLAVAWSATVSWKVSCVALTNVVARADPPTCATEPDTKLLPVTVTVAAVLEPTISVAGFSVIDPGTGLSTANVADDVLLEEPFIAATVSVAAVASCTDGTTAVTCVLLT
jgi:hypothetical protein